MDISVSSPKGAGGWVRRGLHGLGSRGLALLSCGGEVFCDAGTQLETKGLLEAWEQPGKDCF